jgi:acetyl-CoA carboxylase biotin carboxyl carrier protein
MTPQEMKQLAELLQTVPGIKSIELEDVQGLAQLLRDTPEIGSIEVKGLFGTKVVITRTGSGSPTFMTAPAAYHAPAAPAAGGGASAAGDGELARAVALLKDIRSPMVGTFYKSPEPGAEPYVKVGSRVTSGQTVCIIEAMKIMNEIEAEIAGVVREIMVDDAQPVEFGQVLFRVDPNG